MKKKIAIMLTALALTFTASFANGVSTEIPNNISTDFSRHFTDAKNVSWVKEDSYYKASFDLEGSEFFAYYGSDASFIGIAHSILSDKLPIMLQAGLKKGYSGYWITDLYEYSVKHEPGYVATLENADQTIVLKSNDLSTWHVEKKIKKD